MSALETYCQHNFSSNGPAARELFQAVASETREGNLHLTSEYNADADRPAGLTPRMSQWFRMHVAPLRSQALAELRSEFQKLDFGAGISGFIPEARAQEYEAIMFRQIAAERKQFFASAKVLNNAKELSEKEQVYEEKKLRNGGDDAHEWPLFPYFMSLFIIAIPEAIMNYSSFTNFFTKVPAIALAITLVVAVAIGWGSHVAGVCLKQWRERFGGAASSTDRASSIRYLSIATLLVLIALAIVGYARYFLFLRDLDTVLVTGGSLGLRHYAGAILSFAGNVVVYLLGIGIAYTAHCKIPDLGRDERIVRRLRSERDRMFRKELEDRMGRHVSHFQREMENLTSLTDKRIQNLDRYKSLRPDVDRFLAIDNSVIALLETYKSELTGQARSGGIKMKFQTEDVHSPKMDMNVAINGDEYESNKIKLRMI